MDTYCPVDDLIQVNLKMHFFHFRANFTAATNVSITNILSKLLEKKNEMQFAWFEKTKSRKITECGTQLSHKNMKFSFR